MPSSSSDVDFGSLRMSGMSTIFLRVVQVGDDARDGERERVVVVGRVVVGDAGLARAWTSAPPSSSAVTTSPVAGLHQRRAAEEDRALPFDDDGLVAHRRHIGAAGRARAHHHGDLRDARRGHVRLVVEDAAEMFAVGKHLGLMRQVGAAGIDQIDAGQMVLARDLLGAQMLLHRHRIIGAALDGGVVAHDHAFAALDAADAGDDAGAVDVAVVHAEGGERRQFQERRAGIDEAHPTRAAREAAFPRGVAALARPCGPPAAASRAALSALRPARMRSALARNSSARVSIAELIRAAIEPPVPLPVYAVAAAHGGAMRSERSFRGEPRRDTDNPERGGHRGVVLRTDCIRYRGDKRPQETTL